MCPPTYICINTLMYAYMHAHAESYVHLFRITEYIDSYSIYTYTYGHPYICKMCIYIHTYIHTNITMHTCL